MDTQDCIFFSSSFTRTKFNVKRQSYVNTIIQFSSSSLLPISPLILSDIDGDVSECRSMRLGISPEMEGPGTPSV